MMRFDRFPLSRRACLAALASVALAAPEGSNGVAIIARSDLPIENLSFAELRRVMLGDRQFWSSNLKVTLLVRAPGSREREVVLKTIYEMSEAQFRQYWIAKVFRAEAASAPRIVYSNEMATELVGQIPGAVAFVDASHVPAGLKVVKINGLLPGQPGYPLR
jgi:ABC-type phosphate transport system substrate-binding protein